MVGQDAGGGGTAASYATQELDPGGTLYTDTVKSDGSTRPLDGAFDGRGLIPAGYNPELPTLVNP